MLPGPTERSDDPGSRRHVIALIEDMKRFFGNAFPSANGRSIPNAWAIVEGEP